jgi:peptidoglycan/LPS O-acetylase OafA/YrhL
VEQYSYRAGAFGLDVLRVLAAVGVLVTHVAFATGVVLDLRFRITLPTDSANLSMSRTMLPVTIAKGE